jgi:hypothetical protein
LLTIAGALLKFRGWTFLLGVYDKSSSVSNAAIRDLAGNTILNVGLAVFFFGVLNVVMDIPPSLGVLMGGVILLAVLRLVCRVNTYSPSEP